MERDKKVLVGISGGVDSAAAVLMLRQRGYEVTGLHLNLYGEPENGELEALSRRLGIPVHTVDIGRRFEKEIVDWFVGEYMRGNTPSPCTRCNVRIKWQVLAEEADRLGCGLLATGHYCRIAERDGLRFVRQGADLLKDQSYYLWQLPQELLARIVFPLGDHTKQQVRAFMEEQGEHELVGRKESMGVCFLRGEGYETLLRKRVPGIGRLADGEIVDRTGAVIGRHKGYPFYTLAQKRGMGLPPGLCVTGIDSQRNRLTAGPEADLYIRSIRLAAWQAPDPARLFASPRLRCKVRGIGRNPEGFCRVVREGDSLRVETEHPAWAVAKGQPVVFYEEDRVAGGGIVV